MELKSVNKLSFNTKAYRVTFKPSKNKFNFIHRENQEEHFIRIFKLPGSRYYKGNNLVFIFRGFLEFFCGFMCTQHKRQCPCCTKFKFPHSNSTSRLFVCLWETTNIHSESWGITGGSGGPLKGVQHAGRDYARAGEQTGDDAELVGGDHCWDHGDHRSDDVRSWMARLHRREHKCMSMGRFYMIICCLLVIVHRYIYTLVQLVYVVLSSDIFCLY